MRGRELGDSLWSLLSHWLSSGESAAPAGNRLEPARTPEEWQQIQEVLNNALEIPSDERLAYVALASAGKPGLRSEVHSLLSAHSRAGMLDRPPPDLAPPPVLQTQAFPADSRTIGRYEILDKLGSGGMGVVYKARDLRLERIVALKFLPPHLGADEHAKSRFLVEAQAAAALDHPNICTIHEIGEADDGHLFLAMPFYDGETLKHRLASGPLSPVQATDIAIQVARGLASAHDRGIVHRDIKPANLVVTTDGVVKILDFGVAKLTDVSLTHPGMTPGTVAYMSPEQARGDVVDARTDLWSLGVLLYEMLTGERPFRGDHDGVVLNAIQVAEPLPISTLRPDVPAALEEVVSRALENDRESRYLTATEMVQALEGVRDPTGAFLPGAIRDPVAHPGGSVSQRPDSGETSSGGVHPEGERRRAAIVASTLSGYDVLVGSFVPKEVEKLLGRIRAAAAEVAARHRGTLNRCAGNEIVLLFGVPSSHEDDGIRAIRSALELHARVRALSDVVEQAGGPKLRLHTGVDTGRVIVHAQTADEGDQPYRITGSASEIAVRLALHAGLDEVWASSDCHHLLGAFFDTEPEDALAVRGREQPLIPLRVLGESGLLSRFEAATKAGLTPYVGRAAEMTMLQRCLDDALLGHGQFAAVTGEAGIGKSRLLHEFRSTLADRGVIFLVGRCQADSIGVPYLPFIEILRACLRAGEPGPNGILESTVARVRDIGAELEDFIPLYLHLLSIPSSDFPVPQHLHGDTFRLAIREALAAILTLSARRQPSVVLLEDWHWADEASLTVLKQVAEVVSGYQLLVVVTSRPGSGLESNSAPGHTPVPLQPLDRSSLNALLGSFLRVQRFPEELGARLHERTGGNPFFLEEICMALLEQGAIRIDGDEARLTDRLQLLDLPDSVEAVIRARLDRLDGNARDVLRLASVVGREFTRGVLEHTVTDSERLPESLDMLKAAGLVQQTQVVPEAMYRFKHILTREVAYASLLEHQRRELHGRVGARIEQLGHDRIEDHLERLAHHFSRADEWPRAIEYGMRSAERAGALAQYAEALQILERTQRWLIHLARGSERRDASLEIMLRQERLCETLGLRNRQQQIINELISILEPEGDRATLAEVYLRQGDVHTLLRRFDEGEEALQRSLLIRRELSDTVGEQKALRSLGLLRWYEGRNREALTCIAEVVAMDRERNDIVALVGDLNSLASVLKALGESPQAILRGKEGLAIADDAIAAGSPLTGDLRVKQAYTLNLLAVLYRDAGDMDRALEHLDRSERISEVSRLPVYLPYHHMIAAHIDLQQGNVQKSISRYRKAVELARKAKYVPGLSQMLRIQGEVLLGLNRYDEARPCLEEAARLFAQLEDRETEAHLWTEIAAACESQQDDAGAMEAWSRARALRHQLGNEAGELEALEGLGATARRHVPEPAVVLAYYREALQLAQTLKDHGAEGRLRNTLGILEWSRGDYAEALQHYESAFIIFEDLQNTASAGLMLNSIAATLKELGRLAEAEGQFEDAITLHRKTGEHQLEGHALAALGDISADRGERERAAECYDRSLEIRRAIGDQRGEGWMLYNLVRCDSAGRTARELLVRASQIAEDCSDHELATVCDELRRVSGY
jgi:predicted ATPase/class 3 adenylate cyclase/predicted negative regulator of RcsB-dependent stress response